MSKVDVGLDCDIGDTSFRGKPCPVADRQLNDELVVKIQTGGRRPRKESPHLVIARVEGQHQHQRNQGSHSQTLPKRDHQEHSPDADYEPSHLVVAATENDQPEQRAKARSLQRVPTRGEVSEQQGGGNKEGSDQIVRIQPVFIKDCGRAKRKPDRQHHADQLGPAEGCHEGVKPKRQGQTEYEIHGREDRAETRAEDV